jgi:hypothetical protein
MPFSERAELKVASFISAPDTPNIRGAQAAGGFSAGLSCTRSAVEPFPHSATAARRAASRAFRR